MRLVNRITRKKFLTEMDLLRLQKHLLLCRMSANSTFLVDKEAPRYLSKLEELDDLFDRIFQKRTVRSSLFGTDQNVRPDRAPPGEAWPSLRPP